MGDENLLEYLHFELVNYCVNDKKVSGFELSASGVKRSLIFGRGEIF